MDKYDIDYQQNIALVPVNELLSLVSLRYAVESMQQNGLVSVPVRDDWFTEEAKQEIREKYESLLHYILNIPM